MNTTAIVLLLGLAAPLVLTGCSKKSDDTAAATPAPTAPAVAKCPIGSTMDSTSNCKATGLGRVATLTWNGALDTGQMLTLRNLSGRGLKAGLVSLWFYDRSGKRLDVAGAKKYAAPVDVFGSNIKPGESRSITFPLAKAAVPDGAVEIEGELVSVTLLSADGTDGPTWKNDDLNADERAMAGAPSPNVPGVVATALRPGLKRPPPPPPPHR
jgi:hypothetical protein